MPNIAVFAGPSIPSFDRVVAEGLVYLPAAARGDIARVTETFDALLLIDGVFLEDLAPSPKEILAACRRVPTFGAASIGALRAVECAPFGAQPLGIIARWYGNGAIDGDDEVAVVFDPSSERALSVPLVNVRFFAWLARRRGLLAADECQRLLDAARRVFYADRTWDDILEGVALARRPCLLELARRADLKRIDGVTAVRSVLRRFGMTDPAIYKMSDTR